MKSWKPRKEWSAVSYAYVIGQTRWELKNDQGFSHTEVTSNLDGNSSVWWLKNNRHLVWGRMDTCICMAESLPCSPETITLFVNWLWSEVKWSEVAQSCPTLSNPMNCSLPGSSITGYTPIQNKKLKKILIVILFLDSVFIWFINKILLFFFL